MRKLYEINKSIEDLLNAVTDPETGEHIDGWLDDPEYSDDGVTLKKIPFKETRNYVKKVTRAQKKYQALYSLS